MRLHCTRVRAKQVPLLCPAPHALFLKCQVVTSVLTELDHCLPDVCLLLILNSFLLLMVETEVGMPAPLEDCIVASPKTMTPGS